MRSMIVFLAFCGSASAAAKYSAICQNNDYIGEATTPTTASGLCDAAVTAAVAAATAASSASTPNTFTFATKFDPTVCASCTLNPIVTPFASTSPCVATPSAFYVNVLAPLALLCCTSQLSACSVPNVCYDGASDFISTVTANGVTSPNECGALVNSQSIALYGPLAPTTTNVPTSWSTATCAEGAVPPATVPTFETSLAAVATDCCKSKKSACVPKPAPAPAAEATCFSGSDSVTMQSGASKSFADVVIGDRILTANAEGTLSFSDVVFLPHAVNKEVATFAELTTDSGKSIKATKMHLLQSCSGELAYAGSFKKGGCLSTVDGPETIVSAAVTTAEGLYTAVTQNEFIVVNGILASPFAVSHAAGHYYYNIHRAIYKVSPSLLTSHAAKALNAAMASTAAVALSFSAVSM